MNLNKARETCKKISENICKVIVGNEKTINFVLASFLCSGHVLLEDVPGVGKTMLAKCLSRSVDCKFKRIQFTPDLLPSDLTGVNFFNQKTCEFVYRPGPVFSNILLADEINRATPRTQSSLMECMEERQVTVDGESRILEKPFFVIATQNPVETQGTFPLPEAQMDRFLMRLKMGYPSASEGINILDRFQQDNPFPQIQAVTDKNEIRQAQEAVKTVRVSEAVKEYIINIVEETRNNDKIILGISPRGSLALMIASQALAMLKDKEYVSPDEVKEAAVPVLAHRIILKGYSISAGMDSSEALISSVLDKVTAPVENIKEYA